MDISGQLQIPASLPLDKFFLVHISYGAEIFGGEKKFPWYWESNPDLSAAETVASALYRKSYSSLLAINTNQINPPNQWKYWVSIFRHGATAPVGQGLLIIEGSLSHSDTPQSVGFLWTSDQPVAETATWQYKTITIHRHPCPGVTRTHDPSKRTATDARLRTRGHWDRHRVC